MPYNTNVMVGYNPDLKYLPVDLTKLPELKAIDIGETQISPAPQDLPLPNKPGLWLNVMGLPAVAAGICDMPATIATAKRPFVDSNGNPQT